MAKVITIVGGGLAGLAAANGLARRGVPVELHEAGRYPRHRVCGEFLCGVSDACLQNLGILETLHACVFLDSMAWFSDGKELLRRTMPAPGRGLSRFRMDAALHRAAVTAGVRVFENSRASTTPAPGRLLCQGRQRAKGKFVGLKCHFLNCALECDLEMHLGRGGYLGLCRIEDGRVNACGLFPTGSVQGSLSGFFATLRASGLEAIARRLETCRPDPCSLIGVAGFQLGWQPPMAGTIGDASAIIPPFTGNGMSMALEGAECAVEALTPYALGERSWADALEKLTTMMQKKFHTRMSLSTALHPFLLHPGFLIPAAGLLPVSALFRALR